MNSGVGKDDIEVRINGRMRRFDAPLKLVELLQALGLPGTGVAVERNGVIVKRETFDETVIQDRDELEIVTLVGGG